MINVIQNLNCLAGLQQVPDGLVSCCVTSPPYFGLRDYGNDDQIGLEKTPDEYIQKLVEVFREVRRVLKDDGTLWVNIGDSYASSPTGNPLTATSTLQGGKQTQIEGSKRPDKSKIPGIKPKDLIGIPWMLAFALRSDGWFLRQDIIWHKPNPMPESVKDRCTRAHEYIFLLSKSRKYYFDQESIMQPVAPSVAKDKRLIDAAYKTQRPDRGYPGSPQNGGGLMKRSSGNKRRKDATERGAPKPGVDGSVPWEGEYANKKSVWTVSTKPFGEDHFATYPQDLIVDCIKAGCPLDGIVLDPFMGGGTTALVARKLQRNFIGFEINKGYVDIANRRLQKELGLFV